MSVNNEPQNYTGGATIEKTLPQNGVYASLFNKINLTPVAEIGDLNSFEDNTVMAETSADARVTAAVQVFMQCLQRTDLFAGVWNRFSPRQSGDQYCRYPVSTHC